MSYFSIAIPPGVIRDRTDYMSEGRWVDSDKIRFRGDDAESIGGWSKNSDERYLGIARRMMDWVTVDGGSYVAVGTTSKLYIKSGSSYKDVTSIRKTVALGTDPLSMTDGSPIVEVTDVGHAAVKGDYVTFSGAPGTVNGIPQATLNAEHRITEVVDVNTYRIWVAATATATGSGGGSSMEAAYQENVGLDTYIPSSGWGAGAWGSGSWGGSTALSPSGQLRIWDTAQFGDDLLACIRSGRTMYWDESDGTDVRAKHLADLVRRVRTLDANPISATNTSTTITVTDELGHDVGVGDTFTLSGITAFAGLSGSELNAEQTVTAVLDDTRFQFEVTTAATSTATGGGSSVVVTYVAGEYYAPSRSLAVGVSEQARHAVCLGCNPIGSNSIDPMFVRWSDSEDATVWRPKPENLAGGIRLSLGSIIVSEQKTRQERLIFTDAGIVSMRYVGAPFVFSFNDVASNVRIIGPNAATAVNDVVYFMGRGGFYRYSGNVQEIPCPHEQSIFDEIDRTQPYKVFVASNTDFNEVTWFYQTMNSDGEIDRYITYNYQLDVWYGGTLARAAWTEANTLSRPIAASAFKNTSPTDPITTVNTESEISVNIPNHGLSAGEYVLLQDFPSVGGIPENVINNEFIVAGVIDDDNVTIETYYTATSSETGGGEGTFYKSGLLYDHEIGRSADGQPLEAYIESGDMDLGEGFEFQFIRKMIPDVKFYDTFTNSDYVTFTVKGRRYPNSTQSSLFTVQATPVLGKKSVRGRARQIALRAEASTTLFGWRLGKQRLQIRGDGRN